MFIGPGILGPMFVRPPVLENGHPNFNGDLRVTFQNHNIQRPQTSFVVRNPVANIPVPGPSVQPDRVPRNTEQDVSVFGMNMFVPPILEQKGKLRPIVIDGSNVAMGHGNNRVFSCRGIKICVEYFKRLGHETILAFVPRYRTKLSESVDTHILDELENEGIVRFTPSRDLDGGRRIASYDDRYVIQCAAAIGGVIVSNDNFRDLLKEEPAWRNIIETRLLQFTWVTADLLIFPQDPLGRNGPPLHAFLRF
jgi:ribonuclease ZC3H12